MHHLRLFSATIYQVNTVLLSKGLREVWVQREMEWIEKEEKRTKKTLRNVKCD